MSDCIFCKIVKKDLPSKVHYEDDKYLVFEDLYPKAPVHLLIIPKMHLKDVRELTDRTMISEMTEIANQIAGKMNLIGFRLMINNGKEAGQIIFHLHMHLMGWK